MCIGYHFTWNTFEGLVYGMPVSGLDTPKMIVTSYPTDNLINGGSFGIEGGILTTVVTLLGFVFVRFYYRKSAYGFFDGQSSAVKKLEMIWVHSFRLGKKETR